MQRRRSAITLPHLSQLEATNVIVARAMQLQTPGEHGGFPPFRVDDIPPRPARDESLLSWYTAIARRELAACRIPFSICRPTWHGNEYLICTGNGTPLFVRLGR